MSRIDSATLNHLVNTFDNGIEKLAKNLSAIAGHLAAVTQALEEKKQTKKSAPTKSNAFLYIPAGFLLLASAAGAYYYREKIKQAFSSDAQTQTNPNTAPMVERADAASQTEEQLAQSVPTITISTETRSSDALQTSNQAGLFSATTTGNSSPVTISLQNSPTDSPNLKSTDAATEQGGWFNRLAWGR